MLAEKKKSPEKVSFFWVGPTFRQNLTFSLSQISNYKNASKNKESFKR
jgi:hypothetical protein